MTPVVLQANPSCYTNSSEKKSVCFCMYIQKLSTESSCLARHDEDMCFLLSSRHRILLLTDTGRLLQKLDLFCFTTNTWNVPIRSLIIGSVTTVAKSGQLFNGPQSAMYFYQRNRTVDRTPSLGEARLFRKNCKGHSMRFIRTAKWTQASRSIFPQNIEQKRTKVDLKLVKLVACFPDGHANCSSNWVLF